VAARSARFVMAYSNVGCRPTAAAAGTWRAPCPRIGRRAADVRRAVEAESACMRWAGEPPGRHGAGAAGSPGSGRQLHGRAPQRPGQLKELLDEAAHQPLSAQLDLERAHFLRNLTTPTRAKASPLS
jgi:hypothetical protein